jgi:hypothetical protein
VLSSLSTHPRQSIDTTASNPLLLLFPLLQFTGFTFFRLKCLPILLKRSLSSPAHPQASAALQRLLSPKPAGSSSSPVEGATNWMRRLDWRAREEQRSS